MRTDDEEANTMSDPLAKAKDHLEAVPVEVRKREGIFIDGTADGLS